MAGLGVLSGWAIVLEHGDVLHTTIRGSPRSVEVATRHDAISIWIGVNLAFSERQRLFRHSVVLAVVVLVIEADVRKQAAVHNPPNEIDFGVVGGGDQMGGFPAALGHRCRVRQGFRVGKFIGR